ncbi:MAG: DUF2721 domain-containing protein [Betaproteobacteria bacterium]|jgi:Protein of unknown function (DUF2721).|nr:DUF2721 domain-containing protein [Betaproteobacteria bacterium]
MTTASTDVITLAHVIQQAVAPVFLLTGIGAFLSVLTSRLGRVIDRFRVLDIEPKDRRLPSQDSEMRILHRRSRWIHWSITLCTLCALLICIVIAALFVGSESGHDPSRIIAILFIVAMLMLIAGLCCFLREIALATGVISLEE